MSHTPVSAVIQPSSELERDLRARARDRARTVAQQIEKDTEGRELEEENAERDISSEEESEMADDDRPLNAYGKPDSGGLAPSIARPTVNAPNFEIKSSTISMIQNTVQFDGNDHEDPGQHIAAFLEVCSTFSINNVSDDAIRLRLFPFSLRGRAKSWLKSLPAGSITTWNQLAQAFVEKYFPPEKTAKLKNRIMTFKQDDDESLHVAWERFRDLLIDVPHHGLSKRDLVNLFYQGLGMSTQERLDVYAGGDFGTKTPTEAYDMIEKAALKSSSRSGRGSKSTNTSSSRPGVHAVDTYAHLTKKIDTLSAKFDQVQTQSQSRYHDVSQAQSACEECCITHEPGSCLQGVASGHEEVNYLGNQNRPRNDPYSNTYNQGWRDHPNFGWKTDGGNPNQQGSQQRAPAPQQTHGQNYQARDQQRGQNYQPNDRDQRRGQNHQQVQPYAPIVVDNEFNPQGAGGRNQQYAQDGNSSNSRMEEMMSQLLVNSNNANQLADQRHKHNEERFLAHEGEMRSQKASMQAIERQVGQMAQMISERQQGSLPGNTEPNPRGGHTN